MRVKLGSQWHDSRDEPICIQLGIGEQKQIAEMNRSVATEGKYAVFPDSWCDDRDAKRRWLSDDEEEDSTHA